MGGGIRWHRVSSVWAINLALAAGTRYPTALPWIRTSPLPRHRSLGLCPPGAPWSPGVNWRLIRRKRTRRNDCKRFGNNCAATTPPRRGAIRAAPGCSTGFSVAGRNRRWRRKARQRACIWLARSGAANPCSWTCSSPAPSSDASSASISTASCRPRMRACMPGSGPIRTATIPFRHWPTRSRAARRYCASTSSRSTTSPMR